MLYTYTCNVGVIIRYQGGYLNEEISKDIINTYDECNFDSASGYASSGRRS